ncbi:hypothetical protein [Cellulomonas terrae]|uniref:hypothetical protein n=1 Tax=Cellulomonas terrae TaxID=311234 RepID=UPI0011BD880D|nr:hypothetical protein [Cellulomonas terrae]
MAATRDAIRDDLSPLRRRMTELGVPTAAMNDVLSVADRLDTDVLPTLDWHVARARDLASLRYGGSMGAVLPVVDVDGPFGPPPDPFTQTPSGDGSTALTWPAAPFEVREADRQATETSDPIASWFEDRFAELDTSVQNGFDWLVDTWDRAVETGAELGDWWEATTADLGGWIDECLVDVRELIGRHVAVFRFLADACRVLGWVVVAFGVVLTVGLAVIGAMGGSALGAVFGIGVGAVPGGGAGALAGAAVGLKVLGAGFAMFSVGDFLDVAADWGEGTTDGQDLLRQGSLEITLALCSLIGIGVFAKILHKVVHGLPDHVNDRVGGPPTDVPPLPEPANPRAESGMAESLADSAIDVHALRAAVSTRISTQRQGRHVVSARQYAGGSYFSSADDAQRVLDDFHSGAAEVLGRKGDDIVVQDLSVTGFNHNPGAGFPDQATNIFFIKGSVSPSVVPYNPNWTP